MLVSLPGGVDIKLLRLGLYLKVPLKAWARRRCFTWQAAPNQGALQMV